MGPTHGTQECFHCADHSRWLYAFKISIVQGLWAACRSISIFAGVIEYENSLPFNVSRGHELVLVFLSHTFCNFQ